MLLKSELDKIKTLDYRIKSKKEQIKTQAELIYTLRGVKYTEIKAKSYKGADWTLLRKFELEEELQRLIEERQKIIDIIDAIDNDKIREIIYKKYVEHKELKEIAVEMNLTYKHVRKLHSDGTKRAQKGHRKGTERAQKGQKKA